MAAKKGFTLLEIIIALIITGILAAFAVSIFTSSIEQTKAQIAKNNLLAIAAGQEKYFEDFAAYCTTTTGNSIPCGGNNSSINTNLHLNIAGNDSFIYSCSSCTIGAVNCASIPYNCTAGDGTDTLTLNPSAQYPTSTVSCVPNGCGIT